MPLSVTAFPAHGARQTTLARLGLSRHHAGLLQRPRDRRSHPRPARAHRAAPRRASASCAERKPTFGSRRCMRHLAALEAHLVVAALARALSLDGRVPQVLPWPAEAPRPTRSRCRLAPVAGLSVLSRMSFSPSSARALDLEEMRCGLDHAAILRRCRRTATVWWMRRSPRPRALAAMLASCPCRLLHERDLDLLLALCCVHALQPVISSRLLPRFAAISSGERIFASAFTVARTTLMGLREP